MINSRQVSEIPKVKNNSGLRPLGHAVLVEPYEPEIKKSMLVMPSHVAERTAMAETRALIIEVGANAWRDEPPRAKPGDKILISRFAGVMVTGTKDGKLYRMVNDRDIHTQIEVES